MVLSIVIISWNSLGMLKKCLHSLAGMMRRADVEVIWVDNGSTDGSEEWVRSNYPSVSRHILPRNYGVAYARNRGVEASRGKYVLFLDDDTESGEDSIMPMLDFLQAHPHAGICGTALRDRQGNLQDSFKKFPGLGVKIGNVVRSWLGRKRKVSAPAHVTEVDYLIGACQMIRREVFEKVGMLDENIFYGPEDADFCLRAQEAGWRVCYLPNVSITHHWRRSTSINPLGRLGRKHLRALFYFYRKHRRWW
ncbi:MAG: glycosyltransferase family 2 protein [Bacteroidales bacterium]|nr:glycosyltransferase family 2 protein [Bacteroidales bacterium]